MRINKFIAASTGLSRRTADTAITDGRVTVNGAPVTTGYIVQPNDSVVLDDTLLAPPKAFQTILLNKPRGYVCSRNGQGSVTIYNLIPTSLHHLKPIGRLDKDSSGLLLLTNDGTLAQELTHPSNQKVKEYEITLDKPLAPLHQQMISDYGVNLPDGPSKLSVQRIESYRAERGRIPDMASGGVRAVAQRSDGNTQRGASPSSMDRRTNSDTYLITMHEGRNRQIRRTFAALGYEVTSLHRTKFGTYTLGTTASGSYTTLQSK